MLATLASPAHGMLATFQDQTQNEQTQLFFSKAVRPDSHAPLRLQQTTKANVDV